MEIALAITVRIIALIFVGLYWLVYDQWAENVKDFLENLE